MCEPSHNQVIEEEELAAIQKQQDEFDRARMQELIEVQRLEAAEKRRQEETVMWSGMSAIAPSRPVERGRRLHCMLYRCPEATWRYFQRDVEKSPRGRNPPYRPRARHGNVDGAIDRRVCRALSCFPTGETNSSGEGLARSEAKRMPQNTVP